MFGTFYSTELSSNAASSLTDEVVSVWDDLDNIFSTSITGSIVYNINNANSNELVAIDTDFLYIWDLAVSMSELSAVFNPWYFPLVELWGFSPDTYTGVATSIPTDAEITETLSYCSADCFVIDRATMTITKTDSRAQIDFGAFLKGYAVDVGVDIVQDSCDEYLINVGGTIATNRNLTVMVTNPRGSGYVASFTLDNEAVATSGDYERYYIYDDVRYSHIISTNGYPSICGDNMPISVTVVGASATYCDTLSTVIMILGEGATELVESLGYSALVITEDSYYVMGDKNFDVNW